MPPKKSKAETESASQAGVATETAPASQGRSSNGENVAGYFRPIFRDNPKLLKERSNEELYQRWLKDHPGESEVPLKVKQCLSNLKSVLRKSHGKAGRPKKDKQPAQEVVRTEPSRPSGSLLRQLELLEQQIDEALALAKHIDRENLEDVIRYLRAARNRVVVLMGWE